MSVTKDPSPAPDPQPSAETADTPSPGKLSPDAPLSAAYLAEVVQAVVTSNQLLTRAEMALSRSAHLSKQLKVETEHLRSMRKEHATAREELRMAVARVVRIERDRNEPPERALVAVKEKVLRLIPSTIPPTERVALEESVVRWAIDAYYAAAS